MKYNFNIIVVNIIIIIIIAAITTIIFMHNNNHINNLNVHLNSLAIKGYKQIIVIITNFKNLIQKELVNCFRYFKNFMDQLIIYEKMVMFIIIFITTIIILITILN